MAKLEEDINVMGNTMTKVPIASTKTKYPDDIHWEIASLKTYRCSKGHHYRQKAPLTIRLSCEDWEETFQLCLVCVRELLSQVPKAEEIKDES